MLLRGIMNIYVNRRARAQYGDRILRESAVLRGAAEVWSDVASDLGHGFRSSQAGPQLHGELRSGASFEIEILETDVGEYRTVASATHERATRTSRATRWRGEYRTAAGATHEAENRKTGSLRVVPRDGLTRVLSLLSGSSKELPPAFTERFWVRASDAAPALSPKAQEILLELADRGPQLYGDDGSFTLVLEGVELVHARLEAILALLDELT